MFRYRKLASALMVAGALNAGHVSALGLGEMTMHSALNQPLDAEIKLRSVGDLDDVQILVAMADSDAFNTAGIERTFFLNNIRFEVKLDGSGDGVIKLKSQKRLNEPFLDFLLDVKWPTGRVQRSYTALVDLPAYTAAEAPAVTLGKVEAVAAVKEVAKQQVAVQPVKTVDVSKSDDVVSEAVQAETSRTSQVVIEPTASQSDTYRIQRDDTLWALARRLKPSSDISVQQTMLAIQRMNEHAFVAGNINRLKAGEVIRVPSEQAVRDISARQAMAEVSSQNREWQEVQLEAGEGRTLRQVSAPEDESYLRLSSAGAGSANGSDVEGSESQGGASLQHAEEALEVSKLENEELSQRVDSLSSQVEQLERLLELKDAELANLQNKLGEVNEQQSQDVVEAVEQVQEPLEAVAEEQPEVTEEVKPEEEKKEAVAEENAPEPVAPVTSSEPGLVEQLLAKPIYLGGVAIAILLLVAGFILRRKSKEEQQAFDELTNFEFDEEEDKFAATAEAISEDAFASDETVEQDVIEEPVEELEEVVSEVEVAPETTTMQTGDAIGEADIYIAYGRYEQAAELLQNAIAASPDEVELRTKLLEVYLESQNKEGFQQQFVELQSRGFDDAVGHAKELLTSVEGASGWLDDLSAEPAAEAELDVAESLDDEVLNLDLGLDTDEAVESELDADLDLSLDEDVSLDLDEDVSDDLSLDLDDSSDDLALDLDTDLEDDLSLDLGEASEDATQIGDAISIDDALLAEPSTEAQTMTEEPAVDDLDLDLDIDLGVEESQMEDTVDLDMDLGADDDLSLDLSGIDETNLDAGGSEEPVVEAEDEILDLDDLDLDLDTSVSEESASETPAEEGDFDLDLDLDLGDLSEESQEVVGEQVQSESEVAVEDDLDLGDFDLGDLDVVEASDEAAEIAEEESSSVEPVEELSSGESDDLSFEEADFDLSELDDVLSDLSLDDVDGAAVAEEAAVTEPEVVEESVEESAAVESEVVAPAAEPVEEAALSTLEGEDLEFLSDADEVSTKLDLAQAYVEMGDVDGARDILMEVMKEGNDEQKTEASSLLDSID